MERSVGGIGGKITEERLISVPFDEIKCILKPDICAVTGNLFGLPISKIGIVKVIVIPEIRRLGHSASPMIQCLVKSPVMGRYG